MKRLGIFAVVLIVGVLLSWGTSAMAGGMTCHATHNDGTTVFSSSDMSAVQDAITVANVGSVVKVAGTCTGMPPSAIAGAYIDKSITLRGGYSETNWNVSDPNNQPTILDGDETGQVVLILATNVVMENLTVTGGEAETGGGIQISFAAHGTVTLHNLIVEANTNQFGSGGGIHGRNVDLIIEDSEIRNNFAVQGGGIYLTCENTLSQDCIETVIRNTHIADNIAQNAGGGMFIARGPYRIEGVTIVNNQSTGSGGGIYNSGATLTLVGSSLEDNSTTAGFGGGLHNRYGFVTVDAVAFINNSAPDNEGGGIYNGRVLTINASVFRNNQALNGGAIFGHGFETLTITGSDIDTNIATWSGGGIYNEGSVALLNTTIRNNIATLWGGGVYNDGVGIISLEASTVANNIVSGQSGGGGGVFNQGMVEMTNVTVSGNSAETLALRNPNLTDAEIEALLSIGGGGGLLNNDGEATLIHVTFADNRADIVGGYHFGGGIHNTSFSQLRLTNVLAAYNVGGDCVQRASLLTNITNWAEDGGCLSDFSGDPQLLSLEANGGPTETHALDPESGAIDVASETAPPTIVDQRGVARPQGDAADIGAYEFMDTQLLFLPIIVNE